MSKLAAALRPDKEMSPYERFRAQVNKVRPDITGLVGEKNVDKFVRVCLNAVQANPAVLQADRRSLMLACLRAAQDQLLPDGREAVLNIYRTRVKQDGRDVWLDLVQYMPMAYGLIQKIYDAGASYVDAVAVFEKDRFEYQRGDEPKIVHVPYDGAEDPGAVKASYIIVKLRTGETKREVMFARDIEKVREKSKAKDGMMWKEFYDQAAIKSVIHRVVKQLPRSEKLEATLAHDNEVAGLQGVEPHVESTGVNLEALVDMRFENDKTPPPPTANGRKEPSEDHPTPPAPKAGDKGTPELKQRFLDAFASSKDGEIISLKADEMRFFKWDAEDEKELNAAYQARMQELEGGA